MADFTQYREALSAAAGPVLRRAITEQSADAGDRALSVSDARLSLAAPAAMLLLDDDASLYEALADGLARLPVLAGRDAEGQACGDLPPADRPTLAAHYPFVLHLHLAAFGRRYESLPAAVWGKCEDRVMAALEPARAAEQYGDSPPPASQVHVVLWQLLCIYEQSKLLSREADAEWVDSAVHQIAAAAGPNGELHVQADDETPQAWQVRERCALHALANIALQMRKVQWSKRVQEAAKYMAMRPPIQSAAGEPWALFAFAWSDANRPIDALLQNLDKAPTLLSALLITDAADALAEFADH